MRFHRFPQTSFVLLVLLAVGAGADPGSLASDLEQLPRIVNGVETFDDPDVVAILRNDSLWCSGTIIGCGHVLTAGHCAVGLVPGDLEVFGQTIGFRSVASISLHPDFVFTTAEVHGDLAVLSLGAPATGVRPASINTLARAPLGTEGTIVGYGVTDGGSGLGSGLKRMGRIETTACQEAIDDDEFVCWTFSDPLGPPGENSNTCSGDSGGPLFVELQEQRVVAGVTSGGNASCFPEDRPFDADVFVGHEWIEDQAPAGSLGGESCVYGAAGTPGNDLFGSSAELDAESSAVDFVVDVPLGTQELRVTLNGDEAFINDFDLYVNRGTPPVTDFESEDNDCSSVRLGTIEACVFTNPEPGTWYITAHRFEGEGTAQVLATLHGTDDAGCVETATSLCLQQGRFAVEVTWRDFEDRTGPGTVVPGGSDDSGLFWFFGSDNWEQLIKVLDGCAINDRFWVFAASTTNVEYTITVTDTHTGAQRQYVNPLGTPAPALTDTDAFATCP